MKTKVKLDGRRPEVDDRVGSHAQSESEGRQKYDDGEDDHPRALRHAETGPSRDVIPWRHVRRRRARVQ